MTSKPAKPEPIRFDDLPPGTWTGQIRVRFADCDPAGIVYFARHFELVHGIVEDWFEEAIGISHADIIGVWRVGLGYAHAEADFFSPAFDGDRLVAAVMVGRIGRSSIGLTVAAWRDLVAVLTAQLVLVTTSLETHSVIDIPRKLRTLASRQTCSAGH